MSDHSRMGKAIVSAIRLVIPVFFIVFIAACSAAYGVGDLSAAIADGVIIPPGVGRETGSLNFNLTKVYRGSIRRDTDLTVSADFMITQELTFRQSGGLYSGALAGPVGTRVQAGDILGEQSFETTQPVEIARYRLELQIEQFEAQHLSERTNRMQEMQETRAALALAGVNDGAILRLQIARQELQLERFLHESEQTRRNYHKQLEDISLSSERIYAPFDGVLTAVRADATDTIVADGTVFFVLANERYMEFRVNASADVIRPGNVLTIKSDDMAFEAAVVSPHITGVRSGILSHVMRPADPDAFEEMLREFSLSPFDLLDMSFVVEIRETLVCNALILPARAIRQEDRAYYVLIYSEGRLMKRYITRGFQFQGYAEILMGVEEGQMVVLP